jgi:hypothetical protein
VFESVPVTSPSTIFSDIYEVPAVRRTSGNLALGRYLATSELQEGPISEEQTHESKIKLHGFSMLYVWWYKCSLIAILISRRGKMALALLNYMLYLKYCKIMHLSNRYIFSANQRNGAKLHHVMSRVYHSKRHYQLEYSTRIATNV